MAAASGERLRQDEIIFAGIGVVVAERERLRYGRGRFLKNSGRVEQIGFRRTEMYVLARERRMAKNFQKIFINRRTYAWFMWYDKDIKSWREKGDIFGTFKRRFSERTMADDPRPCGRGGGTLCSLFRFVVRRTVCARSRAAARHREVSGKFSKAYDA